MNCSIPVRIAGQVLLIFDANFERLKKIPGRIWRNIFDYRKMLTIPALKGIYLYHEFIGPVIPLESVIYLGEGHTPVIEANNFLQERKQALNSTLKMTARIPAPHLKTGAWPAH